MSNRSLVKAFNVSEKAQKNFGESTHPISRTKSTQIVIQSLYGAYGTTYVNATTWDGRIVPRWQASIKLIFETQKGPSTGSASQIALRMRGNARPNCIDSWVISLYIVLLTLGISISGCANRFRMKRSWHCAWGTATMREILSISPDICTASSARRRRIKLSFTLPCISPWTNPIIYGVHADTCDPFFMALSRAYLDQGNLVLIGMTSSA